MPHQQGTVLKLTAALGLECTAFCEGAKDRVVKERGFETLRLQSEDVAEFD